MAIDTAEDDDGGLWILTNTHLCRYIEKNESFELLTLPVGMTNHSNQSASKLIGANKPFSSMQIAEQMNGDKKQICSISP